MPISKCLCLDIAIANLREATGDRRATIVTVVAVDGHDSAPFPAIQVKYRPRKGTYNCESAEGLAIKPVTILIQPTFCPFCGKRIKIKETL